MSIYVKQIITNQNWNAREIILARKYQIDQILATVAEKYGLGSFRFQIILIDFKNICQYNENHWCFRRLIKKWTRKYL